MFRESRVETCWREMHNLKISPTIGIKKSNFSRLRREKCHWFLWNEKISYRVFIVKTLGPESPCYAIAGVLIRAAFPTSQARPSRTCDPISKDCISYALKIILGFFTKMSDFGLIVRTKYKAIKEREKKCLLKKTSQPYKEKSRFLTLLDVIISITYERAFTPSRINRMCTHSGVILIHKQQSQVWRHNFVILALERLRPKNIWKFKGSTLHSELHGVWSQEISFLKVWHLDKSQYPTQQHGKNSPYLLKGRILLISGKRDLWLFT